MRSGLSGNPNADNSANTDEAKANPYPDPTEILWLRNGEKVTTPAQWWERRRPQLVQDFEREVVGRILDNVAAVEWEALKSVEEQLGETEVLEKRLVGRVDNSDCPDISVNIAMSVVAPKNATGLVPVLMMFGFTTFGSHGELAWRQHDGGHTDLPNIKHFIPWADKLDAENLE
ncbi:hypothetical protein [Aureliella helgolandensis]|uniref:Uncharacterized protein n=1 Tax=Aureliella helgolandensis TaxID=2527968 RepID=A0A518FZW0_9BACT|nr:hypothetical protein [Aureliella helgolandensis]QDV21897.1 hypothetical protein Q31a_01760 [Aureliella helgolandensis]